MCYVMCVEAREQLFEFPLGEFQLRLGGKRFYLLSHLVGSREAAGF